MKERSNIAIFSLAFEPFASGAELAVEEIAKRLPERSFTCFTERFEASWSSRERRGNLTIVRVGRGGSTRAKIAYIVRAFFAAERAHRREPFTAIWGIMAAYGGAAAFLFKFFDPRIPFLLTLQE